MADEPQREIEKTLKAYAQKRRAEAGAPLELHPATRRLLHGEAVRLGPKPGNRPGFWAGILAALRRRLAVVAILATLGVVSAWLFLPGADRGRREALGKTEQLARRDEKEFGPANAAPALSPPPPPAGAPAATFAAGEFKEKLSAGEIPAPTTDMISGSGAMREGGNRRKQPELALNNPASTVSTPAQAPQGSLANSEPAAAPVAPAALPPAPAPVVSALADGDARMLEGRTRAADTSGVIAKDAEAGKTDKAATFAFDDSLTTVKPMTDVPPASRALATAGPTAVNLGVTSAASAAPGNSTLQFYRLPVTVAGTTVTGALFASKGVLDSFRLVQTGDQLLVVDADGSTYSGFIQRTNVTTDARLDAFQSGLAASDRQKSVNELKQAVATKTLAGGGPPAVQSSLFRVTGTNLTSGQLVVFSGTLTPGNVTPPADQAAFKNGVGGFGGGGGAPVGGTFGAAARPSVAASPSLPPSQVHGRALVGGTNIIEVNAAATGP